MLSRVLKCPTVSGISRRFLANLQFEEEYYEDLEPPKIQKTSEEQKTPIRRRADLENVVGALGEQRAKDVFVVRCDEIQMTPYSHKIVCSAFNSRQASAISENLRALLKLDGAGDVASHVKRSTKRSNGWYVTEIDQIQVHVMSEECREKYELEAIWAGDDGILEQIEAERQKILLPPKRN